MTNSILHTASTRGYADHGWLQSKHTFSFGSYHNPERMNFGVLRVLNDDILAPGMGFDIHPHANMEIISIPLEGDLEHQDSMGNTTVIKKGDVQIMSAGTGIQHSEYNKNKDRFVNFLQIWIIPNKRNVTPRYEQITLNLEDRKNKFQQILSPNPEDEGVWINQEAWFHIGKFDNEFFSEYFLKRATNGVYAFILKGCFTINGKELTERDGFGIWNIDKIAVKANSPDAEILLIDVPMNL